MTDKIKTLGIFGAGTMGTGIAINALTHGVRVLLADTSAEAQTRAAARVDKVLSRWVEKGRMTDAACQKALTDLEFASFEQAAGADVVIEAIFEDLAVKRDLMRRIEPHLKPNGMVATNTSALRVSEIATALSDPGRVVGLHYFSPAEINPLCERISRDLFQADAGLVTVMNVSGLRTAAQAARNLAQLGPDYKPSTLLLQKGETNEPFAFEPDAGVPTETVHNEIRNRLLGAILMPIFELVDQGIATLDQIDTGAKLALRYARTPGRIIEDLGEARARVLVDERHTRCAPNDLEVA